MTAILSTISSILAITGLAWAARKALRVPICPICLGIAGTWFWMIIVRALGHAVDATMLALLLGGSVVGIAYQVEKHLPHGRSPLLWKTFFVPAGFVAAYALAMPQWAAFAVTSVALVVVTAVYLFFPATSAKRSATVEDLKKRMQECC